MKKYLLLTIGLLMIFACGKPKTTETVVTKKSVKLQVVKNQILNEVITGNGNFEPVSQAEHTSVAATLLPFSRKRTKTTQQSLKTHRDIYLLLEINILHLVEALLAFRARDITVHLRSSSDILNFCHHFVPVSCSIEAEPFHGERPLHLQRRREEI